MTSENERILEQLANALHRSPVSLEEVTKVLKVAVLQEKSTSFCLEVCDKLRFLPENDVSLVESWLRHALAAARDWRDQYCAVAYAQDTLGDKSAANQAYEARPWLESLGFSLDHDYTIGSGSPESMALIAPEGICDNQTFEVCDAAPSGAGGPSWTPEFIDGRLQVHYFLRPGRYSGSIACGGGDISLVGIAGADVTIIELGEGESLFQSSYTMMLHGLTIRRTNGDGTKLPVVAWRNLSVILITECKISNPGGTAVGSIGEIGEQVEIRRSLIADSRRGIDVQALHVTIDDTRFERITDETIVLRTLEMWPVGDCAFRAERGV